MPSETTHIHEQLGQHCPKCSQWKDAEAFKGLDGFPTRYCDTCREKARAGMKKYHDRKRRGIIVQRGRPSLSSLFVPTYISIPVPIELKDEIISMVNARIDEYLAEHGQPLPPGAVYGEHNPQPAPRPTKQDHRTPRTNSKGPSRPEHMELIDAATPKYRENLETCTKNMFNLDFNFWSSHGKPEPWEGIRKWQKSQPKPVDSAQQTEPPLEPGQTVDK
jgi:hypothetical protein